MVIADTYVIPEITQQLLSIALEYIGKEKEVRESYLRRYLLFKDHGRPFKPREVSAAIRKLGDSSDIEVIDDGERMFRYRELPERPSTSIHVG